MEEPKLYRPPNGTDGDIFQERFCDRCEHDRNEDCLLIVLSMLHSTSDPEYPREWRYDADGRPTCTKFQERA